MTVSLKKIKIVLMIFILKNYVLLYKELSFVTKIILAMSHGQAAVERGFNINNSALKTNISSEGVIAKRLIKDHLLGNNLKPHTIQTRAFKGALQSYATYIDDENKKTIQTKDEEKARYITSDIENWKQKLKTNQETVSMLENEYTQFMELAE